MISNTRAPKFKTLVCGSSVECSKRFLLEEDSLEGEMKLRTEKSETLAALSSVK